MKTTLITLALLILPVVLSAAPPARQPGPAPEAGASLEAQSYQAAQPLDLGTRPWMAGHGWKGNSNWRRGDSKWSSVEGTVIHCAPQVSPCIKLVPNSPQPMRLSNVAIIGSGSGVGVQIGDHGHTPVFGYLNNVLIANFATGMSFAGEDFTFVHVVFQGNGTGLEMTDPNGNENQFLGVRFQHNEVGVHISAGYQNNFWGGLAQGNGIGILLDDKSVDVGVTGFDIEGNRTAGIVLNNNGNNQIEKNWFAGQSDFLRIDRGTHNLLINNRMLPKNLLLLGPAAFQTVLIANSVNGYVDQGKDTRKFP